MNNYFSANSLQRIFKGSWLVGSVIASAIFAFWMFPEVYSNRNNSKVRVWFQTKNPSNGTLVFFPNREIYRKEQLKNLSDEKFFYFCTCDMLPASQSPKCDPTLNWIKIDPHELNCANVAECSSETYTLNDMARKQYYANLTPLSGASISISDLTPLSFTDPSGWGYAAKWPLFFVCLFLALKLGRSLGEFIFLPFDKK